MEIDLKEALETFTTGTTILVGIGMLVAMGALGLRTIFEQIAEKTAYYRLPIEMRSANPDLSKHKTVVQLMRECGYETEKGDTWSLGSIVRDLYIHNYGRPPVKDLRRKTSGTGSHDIAVYPPQMHDQIRKVIRGFKGRFEDPPEDKVGNATSSGAPRLMGNPS